MVHKGLVSECQCDAGGIMAHAFDALTMVKNNTYAGMQIESPLKTTSIADVPNGPKNSSFQSLSETKHGLFHFVFMHSFLKRLASKVETVI